MGEYSGENINLVLVRIIQVVYVHDPSSVTLNSRLREGADIHLEPSIFMHQRVDLLLHPDELRLVRLAQVRHRAPLVL
jgi:hypothetical protein